MSLEIPGFRCARLRRGVVGTHREAGRTAAEHLLQIGPAATAAQSAAGLEADLGGGGPAMAARKLEQLAEGLLIADAAGDSHMVWRCSRQRHPKGKGRIDVAVRRHT